MGNKDYHFPFIWVQGGTVVKRLTVEHLHRREYENPIDTVCVDRGAHVDMLTVRDLSLENHTDGHCAKITNHGTVKTLLADGLSSEEIEGSGSIENLILN